MRYSDRNNLFLYIRALAPGHKNLRWWLQWPPDMFALTSVLLKHTGIYTNIVNPPDDQIWPTALWKDNLQDAKVNWLDYLRSGGRHFEFHSMIKDNCKTIENNWELVTIDDLIKLTEIDEKVDYEKLKLDGTPNEEIEKLQHEKDIEKLQRERAWEVAKALLELHGLADELCAGFGTLAGHYWRVHSFNEKNKSSDNRLKDGLAILHFTANSLLAHTGTLSRIPSHVLRVLPKIRTTSVGLTLRSASHYLTAHQTEAKVKWRTIPQANIDEDTVNILLVPFPYEFSPSWFSPSKHTTHRETSEHTRYFEYKGPNHRLPPSEVMRLIEEAETNVNRVHIIVLPESALTLQNLEEILSAISKREHRDKMPIVLAGVRTPGKDINGKHILGRNQAVIAAFFAGKWYLTKQDKHHRWKIDEKQIKQYGLSGVLASSRQWWEAIEVPRRELSVFASNQWFTFCSLICEDLARQEPIPDVIRGIGPTLLIAILLDGPQLEGRWPGRYASVFADDPGTSVLSMTSLGFTKRSRPSRPKQEGEPENMSKPNTIAIWKDPLSGTHTVDLPSDKIAAVVTVTAKWVNEVTLAGRTDKESGAILEWQGVTYLSQPNENLSQLDKNRSQAEIFNVDSVTGSSIIKNDLFDIRELSLFACLVDAVLDCDSEYIKFLKEICLDGNVYTCLKIHPQRGDLSQILRNGMLEIERENQRNKSRDNVKPYVTWLCKLMEELRKESNSRLKPEDVREHEISWYKLIIDYCAKILECTKNSSNSEEDQFADARQQFPAIPKFLKEDPPSERIYFYVPLALIWAVHSRLADMRHLDVITQESRTLMNRIEALLTDNYDKGWEALFGTVT